MTELESLRERLGRLEAENRLFRRVGGVALVGLSGVLLMGQVRRPGPKTLEAQHFLVKDDSGTLRGFFGMNQAGTGAGIGFVGPGRVHLGANPDGSGLAITDANGKSRIVLAIKADGSTGLEVKDEAQITRAGLNVRSDGAPILELFGKDGRSRVSAVVLADDGAGVLLTDKAGKVRGALASQADGSTGLDLMDAREKPRARLAARADGAPSISLLDDKGLPLPVEARSPRK